MVYYALLCGVLCGHLYATIGPKVLSMSLLGGN